MALDNKAAIETEFAAKKAAIAAITPAQVDSTLAPLDGFVLQVMECREVLLAREALNGRPLSGDPLEQLQVLVDNVRNAAATVRAAVAAIQTALQKL